jgi:hypothetical protein
LSQKHSTLLVVDAITNCEPDWVLCWSCCVCPAGDESDGDGSGVPDLSGMYALNAIMTINLTRLYVVAVLYRILLAGDESDGEGSGVPD